MPAAMLSSEQFFTKNARNTGGSQSKRGLPCFAFNVRKQPKTKAALSRAFAGNRRILKPENVVRSKKNEHLSRVSL